METRQKRYLIPVLMFICALFSSSVLAQTKPLYTINSPEELATSFPVWLGLNRLKQDLHKKIKDYESFSPENWVMIEAGDKLEEMAQGPRVLQLRERLWITRDFDDKTQLKSDLFDSGLTEAVKKFQLRHGLNPDGVVGGATLKYLNLSHEEIVNKLKINLSRLESLSEDFGENYIFVNLPDMRMTAVKNNQMDLGMRAVVGSKKNRTPLFSDTLEYVVLSPKWHVPKSITTKEILPKLREDPLYLEKHNYYMIPVATEPDAPLLEASAIDWNLVDENNLPFRLAKNSGADNDLGYYKFIFPNEHNVYMHDTNSRGFFQNDQRALSHGCVRLSRPLDFAEYLLKEQGWDRETLEKTAKKGEEKYVTLKTKWPVHIRYFTAWVDQNGQLNLRNDIYGLDKKI